MLLATYGVHSNYPITPLAQLTHVSIQIKVMTDCETVANEFRRVPDLEPTALLDRQCPPPTGPHVVASISQRQSRHPQSTQDSQRQPSEPLGEGHT